MSLLFLSQRDFTRSGNVLKTSIRGYSLVFFYAPSCEHSQRRIPLFRELPRRIGGCQFAMLDVTQHMNVVNMSQGTTLPIEYVPLIVLYSQGIPQMIYTGHANIDDLVAFVVDVVAVLGKDKGKSSSNSGSVNNNNVHENPSKKSKIPLYSVGIPITSERTYLEVDCTKDTFIN